MRTASKLSHKNRLQTYTKSAEKYKESREEPITEVLTNLHKKVHSSMALNPLPSLTLPEELQNTINGLEFNYVSPSLNVAGNYSNYVNNTIQSLRSFQDIDYDSIFSLENAHNVNYIKHTPSSNPSNNKKKRLLLLDLDETLVHSEIHNGKLSSSQRTMRKVSTCKRKTISYLDNGIYYSIDLYIRPHLNKFLKKVSELFDLAIFTASIRTYADKILKIIDPENRYFKFRLYRNSCISIQDRVYIKDLRIIKNYSPENVVLMDNSLYSFMNQPMNGVLVNSFYFDGDDVQLITAQNYLVDYVHAANDVRKENEKWFNFSKFFRANKRSKSSSSFMKNSEM